MTTCKEMREIKDGEIIARRLLRSSRPEDVKLMYAAWANESIRIQRLHAVNCGECQKEEAANEATGHHENSIV